LKTTGTGRSISSETSILTAMGMTLLSYAAHQSGCTHCSEGCEDGATSENSVKAKFGLPHRPGPEGLAYEGP